MGQQVVAAVANGHAGGVGAEVVVMDWYRERSHLAPAFLKLPSSSRFLVSTRISGRP